MHTWVRRSLQTALLTGGLLAVGTGIAAADQNDASAEIAGAAATVPVEDGTVVDVPVTTGTGEDLAVTGQAGEPVLTLPVDTNTAAGTTVQHDDTASPEISAPVRVVEADSTPDPDGDLTVTVPVNTSGGNSAAGTTVETSVIHGDIADLVGGGPASGADVTVDLADTVVAGSNGDGGGSVALLQNPVVTIGDTAPEAAREDVLAVPVSLEDGEPSTVGLPVRPGDDGSGSLRGAPLSEDTVVVVVGDLLTDAQDTPPSQSSGPDAALNIPIDTGDLLPADVLGGSGLSGDRVDVDLGDALGLGRDGGGSVITVPVNEGRTGFLGNDLVRVTLPVRLRLTGGPDERGGDTGPGTSPDMSPGAFPADGYGSTDSGSTNPGATGPALLCADPGDASAGSTAGDGTDPAARGVPGTGAAVNPCGIGIASASRPAALPARGALAGLALAGALALSTAVLLAGARRRSVLNRG
jgi:hypothetical protein